MTSVYEATRQAARGFRPVPIPRGEKGPKISEWHKKVYHPSDFEGKNIGLILGTASNGLVDVDLDCPEALELADVFLPRTGMVHGRPSRPRSHRWYQITDGTPESALQFRDTQGAMLVELRCGSDTKGFQTVIPPSVHPSGEALEWHEDGDPLRIDRATLTRAVSRLAAATLLARAFPQKGKRHEFCLALGAILLRSGWDEGEARQFVFHVAKTAKSSDPDTRADTVLSTKARLEAGEDVTGLPTLRDCMPNDLTGIHGPTVVSRFVEWLALESRAAEEPPLTELGMAERTAARYEGKFLWLPERNSWTVYDGRRWVLDNDMTAQRKVISIIRDMAQKAEEGLEALPPAMKNALDIKDSRKRSKALEDFPPADVKRAEALLERLRFARSCEKANTLANIVTCCKTTPGIVASLETFDTQAMLFNVANGTLDLETGTLRTHKASDRLMHLAGVTYDPQAECPQWEAFLSKILPDPALRDWMQLWVGYNLTARTDEQCLAILWGSGANGKSTFVEVIRALTGSYAQNAAAETFLSTSATGKIPNDLAALAGARVVTTSETDQEDSLAESLVKRVTGGDAITARFLRAEFFTFVPKLKLWMPTNNRPNIHGLDRGIWRRLRLVPFTVTIPEPEQDKDLKKKLLTELSGILNWALEGCQAWQKAGLPTPPAILAAVEDYKTEMDPLGEFLQECAIIKETAWVSTGEAFQRFAAWALQNGEECSKRSFTNGLQAKGFARETRNNTRGYRGFGLK